MDSMALSALRRVVSAAQQRQRSSGSGNKKQQHQQQASGGGGFAPLLSLDGQKLAIYCRCTTSTLFEFHAGSAEWRNIGIEGATFLLKVPVARKHLENKGSKSAVGLPPGVEFGYLFVIMNKQSTENYVSPLYRGMKVEVSDSYVMFRSAEGRVLGAWVFDEGERSQLVESMRTAVTALDEAGAAGAAAAAGNGGQRAKEGEASPPRAPAPTASGAPSSNPLEMLKRAAPAAEAGATNGSGAQSAPAAAEGTRLLPGGGTAMSAPPTQQRQVPAPQGPPPMGFMPGAAGGAAGGVWTPPHMAGGMANGPPAGLSREAVALAMANLARDENFISMVHGALLRSLAAPAGPPAGPMGHPMAVRMGQQPPHPTMMGPPAHQPHPGMPGVPTGMAPHGPVMAPVPHPMQQAPQQ